MANLVSDLPVSEAADLSDMHETFRRGFNKRAADITLKG